MRASRRGCGARPSWRWRRPDVILFVIDARDGVVALDELFAAVLRHADKPVVLVANKTEGRAGDAGALEAYNLGFGEPVPISAEHGEGLADLYAAVMAAAPDEDMEDDADASGDKPIRIAIVGRPNAGKSTLINRLVGEDRLLTGPEAGITRDAVSVDWEWQGRRVRLVDTAGLRRKARVEEGLEKLSAQDTIRAITFAEVVLLVMDATHPFETQDLQIADLVEREGRALVFVLAKWDLVEDPGQRLKTFIEQAEHMLPQLRGAAVVHLSAETGRGVDKLMPAVVKAHDDWSTKLKTRDLNDWLKIAVERHPPPAVDGRRVRPKYMAQTKARPPTFVLFASRADKLPDAYRRYLINSIRQSFDLSGRPDPHHRQVGRKPLRRRKCQSGQGLLKRAAAACERRRPKRSLPPRVHPLGEPDCRVRQSWISPRGQFDDHRADLRRVGEGRGVFPWIGLLAHPRSHRARIEYDRAKRRAVDLVGPAAHQRFEPGFRRGVRSPERLGFGRAGRSQKDRPAGVTCFKQRLHRADQTEDAGEIGGHDLVPDVRRDVADRTQAAQHGGGVNQDVELFVALENLSAELIDAGPVGQVHRNQRRTLAAFAPDRIVQVLQRALRAAHRNHLRARRGEGERGGPTDSARRAGHQRRAAGEGQRVWSHQIDRCGRQASTRKDSCRSMVSLRPCAISRSSSLVG